MSKFIFGFSIGAVIGSIVTYKLVKTKFEILAEEEINSVKEVFSQRQTDLSDKSARATSTSNDIDNYKSHLETYGYTNYSDISKKPTKEDKVEHIDKPYVIPPDEFGELDDYETISLTYYSDKVLVDEDDELVEDVEATVGLDSLDTFGEYEEDSVFVRNDRLKCDFEILLDCDKYSEVVKKRPHLGRYN